MHALTFLRKNLHTSNFFSATELDPAHGAQKQDIRNDKVKWTNFVAPPGKNCFKPRVATVSARVAFCNLIG